MIIGVFSDTHNRTQNALKAMDLMASAGVKTIVHCGDWNSVNAAEEIAKKAHELRIPVIGVLGNNDKHEQGFLDYARSAPGSFELHSGIYEATIGSASLAVYHGHHKPTLRQLVGKPIHDIILLGHSHKPDVLSGTPALIVNPGSTAFSIPRRKSWLPTIAIVDTETRDARIVEFTP